MTKTEIRNLKKQIKLLKSEFKQDELPYLFIAKLMETTESLEKIQNELERIESDLEKAKFSLEYIAEMV